MQGLGDKILNKAGEYNKELAGIAPRAAEEIYRIAARDAKKFSIKTKFTQLELYRDGLCDLGRGDRARIVVRNRHVVAWAARLGLGRSVGVGVAQRGDGVSQVE